MLLKFVCVGRHAINSCDIALYTSTSTLFNTKILGLKKINNKFLNHKKIYKFWRVILWLVYNKNDVNDVPM